MNQKLILVLASTFLFLFLLAGCGSRSDARGAETGSVPTAEPTTSATTEPAAQTTASDFTNLTQAEQTELLLNNVWQIAGGGSKDLGYYLSTDEDLQGNRYYHRFYADNTMHEWADDADWNRLYKWEWAEDGTITVTNYLDTTGESASPWYFDSSYLLSLNLNTKDLTPYTIADTYPSEPPIS